MTGFGQAQTTVADATLLVEVKALNSKFLDLSLRLPRIFSEKELDIRAVITEKLERGKISISIEYNQPNSPDLLPQYNEALFISHYGQLKKLADRVLAPYDRLFEIALRAQDNQATSERTVLDPLLYEKCLATLKEAIDQCDQFRRTEGNTLSDKFKQYIGTISSHLANVEKLDPQRVEKIRSKIKGSVTDFFGEEGFDSNRLEQEIIFYIEKLDIHEERVRLKTHLDYFISVMKEPQPSGKKLGFIAQEIGREINTIGSKANDAEMQKEVVMMKEELEKIKEQLNNIL